MVVIGGAVGHNAGVIDRPLDAVPYASRVTDERLRLLGPVNGKRVLVLGVRDQRAAVVFAQEGAHVLVIEPDDDRRRAAESGAAGAGIEWHAVDYAELAFIRADTIDLTFSAGVVDEIEDFARVLRQVHRVLRPHGTFLFAYQHPFALCVEGGAVVRGWGDTTPIERSREGRDVRLWPRPPSEVFVALARAGFRVDALGEPTGDGERVPEVIVWRARKEGA